MGEKIKKVAEITQNEIAEEITDGDLIRLVMAIKRLSKSGMMKYMGVSRQTVYAWLYGKQRVAQYRKPKLEQVVFDFINAHRDFKPSK